MKFGMALRTMGPQSRPDLLVGCARVAEADGHFEVLVQDHVAIPPEDAEGSDGRYLDPLCALAWLAGQTGRIHIGTGVLNLPYRPPLPTAKAIATIQELSGGRLILGIGVGWMEPEFRALGVPRSERGRRTDETLAFLHACFASDEVEANGQRFLFRPRPPRPPILIGGAGRHALERVVRYGDGWLPMVRTPDRLADPVETLRELAAAAGKPVPEVVALGALPTDDVSRAADLAKQYEEAGVTRFVQGVGRFPDLDAFRRVSEGLTKVREAAA